MRDMKLDGDEKEQFVEQVGVGGDEDEKEVTIAKAALSIAELGTHRPFECFCR